MAAFVLLGAVRCGAQGLDVQAAFDSEAVPAGRTATLTIMASWEGTDGAKYILSEAVFANLRNLEIVKSESSGNAAPSAKGTRFERRLVYVLLAKEPGDAETGPIEVKYYQPDVKGTKVASEDEKGKIAAQVRPLPSLSIRVTKRASSALAPYLILGIAGAALLFAAYRLLRTPKPA